MTEAVMMVRCAAAHSLLQPTIKQTIQTYEEEFVIRSKEKKKLPEFSYHELNAHAISKIQYHFVRVVWSLIHLFFFSTYRTSPIITLGLFCCFAVIFECTLRSVHAALG